MNCFKTYDVRGIVPTELNPEIASRIARAFAHLGGLKSVAVGHDPRSSSPSIYEAVLNGLQRFGVDVYRLGLCGTEETYFASCQPHIDGALMITASHNPREYNGLKMVMSGGKTLSPEKFEQLKQLSAFTLPDRAGQRGGSRPALLRSRYFQRLQDVLGRHLGPKMKVVCNPGNGGAGVTFPFLRQYMEVVPLQERPDGTFPNGVPNPMIEENRLVTSRKVVQEKADFGVAWDGDFDRAFLFDERGRFVENYHLTALIASYYLHRSPGARVIHDSRLTWCVEETVRGLGGIPVRSSTGHVKIKREMLRQGAVYGGEMSGHHYFQSLGGFDSGIFPVLLINQILANADKPLSTLLEPYRQAYRVSGEINFQVSTPVREILATVEQTYRERANSVDRFDGLSMSFEHWRFNLRSSNTEPLLRLNVEARFSDDLVRARVAELRDLISSLHPPSRSEKPCSTGSPCSGLLV